MWQTVYRIFPSSFDLFDYSMRYLPRAAGKWTGWQFVGDQVLIKHVIIENYLAKEPLSSLNSFVKYAIQQQFEYKKEGT